MREISSKDNKIFRLCEQLAYKKYRDKLGLYLIEGENLLEEAVKNKADIKTVLARPDYGGGFFGMEDKAFFLSEKLFDQLSQTETSQGIMAIVEKHRISRDRFLKKDGGNFVVLDRLQDPGNIGTILRTADAAGYRLAIVMKGTANVF